MSTSNSESTTSTSSSTSSSGAELAVPSKRSGSKIKSAKTKLETTLPEGHTKKSKKEDPMRAYAVTSGIAAGVVILGVVIALCTPHPTSKNTGINDAGIISHINNNAQLWSAAKVEDFKGWSLARIKKLGQVGISPNGPATLQTCNTGEGIPVLPSEFDARKKWPTCFENKTPTFMRNCTASWALTASSTLTNRYCIADPDKNADLELSSQQLLSCDTGENRGCGGGDVDSVWKFTQNVGLYPESCTGRYTGLDNRKQKCRDILKTCLALEKQKQVKPYRSSSHCVLQTGKAIKSEILLNGPVVALMYLYDDYLVYSDGLYSPMPTANVFLDRKSRMPLTHAVKIVGWGTEMDQEYWLVENSFGAGWGQGGYGKIKRKSKDDLDPMAMLEYNPMQKKDIIILENFAISVVPINEQLSIELERQTS